MWIKSLRIQNYKCFLDCGEIQLSQRSNIVVGQNNVGKTAFLESLKLWNCASHAYRGLAVESHLSGYGVSTFSATISVSGREIIQLLKRYGGDWFIPIPVDENGMLKEQDAESYLQKFFSNENILFSFEFQGGTFSDNFGGPYPSHGIFIHNGTKPQASAEVTFEISSRGYRINRIVQSNGADTIKSLIGRDLGVWIYVFRAERLNLGTSPTQEGSDLRPDASNLPSCLLRMSANKPRFDEFNDHIAEIFPSISRVGFIPLDNAINVRLASSVAPDRDDLLVRLEESGTGIGQVLAILYVAMTKEGAIIAIDEPNSFLHPGAAKKLTKILSKYSKNQYIISTHSTEIIKSAENPNILRITKVKDVSQIESHDEDSVEIEREILSDLGASISDVFGVDHIVWVEGQTEQFVFPIIAEYISSSANRRVTFLALRNTSELEARRYRDSGIWEIYERLSGSAAIMPPKVLFSFDRELRTDTQMQDMQRRSKGRAKFLPRRLVENYFLDSKIIDRVIRQEASFYEIQLDNYRPETLKKFLPDILDKKNCDGAKIIDQIFCEVFDERHKFNKIRHGKMLAKALVEFGGEELVEISDYVRGLIS